MQNHIEQRLMDLDAAVVFDEAELAKSIHEETDAGPCGADHLCQGFLRDPRNQALRLDEQYGRTHVLLQVHNVTAPS